MRVFNWFRASKQNAVCDVCNRVVILLATYLIANVCCASPVIFDTDMGNDIDDAMALAILHALSDRGECELIGITFCSKAISSLGPARIEIVLFFFCRRTW